MAGAFQSNAFQNNAFQVDAAVAVKTGTGGIDPGKKKGVPYKPTGLLEPGEKKKGKEHDAVQARVDESREIAAEIAGRLAREFTEESRLLSERAPVERMSLLEVEREIGILLRKVQRTEEEDLLLLLLMAASA